MKRDDKGFTLIEVVFVLFISSMFISTVVLLYTQYDKERRISKTKENVEASVNIISEAFGIDYAYPCPADRALSPDDDNYLREFNGDTTFCDVRGLELVVGEAGVVPCAINSGQPITELEYNVAECYGCTAGGGLCVYPGNRDIDGGGKIGDDHREIVVLGGIPTRTIRETIGRSFPDELIQDGYGSMLTYAVSRSLAQDGQYEFSEGAISVVDEFQNPTAGMNGNGHYLVLSHGPNRSGAFSLAGNEVRDCDDTSQGFKNNDSENCDYDSEFLQTIFRNNGGGASFDDRLTVERATSVKLWAEVKGSITNLTDGYAGINLPVVDDVPTEPTQLLQVAGDVNLEQGTLRSKEICINPVAGDPDDTSDDQCFDLDVLRSGIACPNDGELATQFAIDSNLSDSEKLGCVEFAFAPNITGDCSPGYVRGIRQDGEVLCEGQPHVQPGGVIIVDLDDDVIPGGGSYSWGNNRTYYRGDDDMQMFGDQMQQLRP